MQDKVILISIDGMRPDGLKQCGNKDLETILREATYTFDAKTVVPSVTLPCHMSMFHSVPPERHGTTTNDFAYQMQPVAGLFEVLNNKEKRCAMYYGWEPLRNIATPGSLVAAEFIHSYSFDHTDDMLTDSALAYMKKAKPDFVFLYMVETDEKGGHDTGWMSETYLDYISRAIANVKRVIDAFGDEYTVIVTADHGGHDRAHGTEMPEDMTIPMIFRGENFAAGKEIHAISDAGAASTRRNSRTVTEF